MDGIGGEVVVVVMVGVLVRGLGALSGWHRGWVCGFTQRSGLGRTKGLRACNSRLVRVYLDDISAAWLAAVIGPLVLSLV
ncbi:hypothetical protein B0H67DRAFT_590588 [Lasiosphaeris hirsuta]|uniref:Uncharacterized protein n=1 Tax=Lasiosphaeris hirsuta TaxID=260670 RepID=A0AA40DPD0_9PEZI|nr:hypothetical protein B0H67DRAFT_590588 [Lasiosphaeris hirsuta]